MNPFLGRLDLYQVHVSCTLFGLGTSSRLSRPKVYQENNVENLFGLEGPRKAMESLTMTGWHDKIGLLNP